MDNSKITKVEILDGCSGAKHHEDLVIAKYYLVNPNFGALNELQDMIDTHKAIDEIEKFINDNFDVAEIEREITCWC